MKTFGIVLCLMAVTFIGYGAVNAQSAQRGRDANEDAAKRTEETRQTIAKFGTGEKVKVKAELFDQKNYSGYIKSAGDTTFEIVDKKGQSTAINYGDVKTIYRNKGLTSLQKGIFIGIGATIGVVLLVIRGQVCRNEPGTC